MTEEKIIAFDSDEAAQLKTVEGWVSSTGFFYGKNEYAARSAGCTHCPCRDCDTLVPKGDLVCDRCGEALVKKNYSKKVVEKWDGKSPVFSGACFTYAYDLDDLLDLCEEHGLALEDLRLEKCEPVFLSQLDAEDLWLDLLGEDQEIADVVSSDVVSALDALNKAIGECGKIGWQTTNIALSVNLDGDEQDAGGPKC